jgi:hypothetical protein
VGAGAVALGASQAAAQEATKVGGKEYKPEFFDKLATVSNEARTAFMAERTPEERQAILAGARKWKENKDAVKGPAETYSNVGVTLDATKKWNPELAKQGGFEDKSQQMSVLSQRQREGIPDAYSVTRVGDRTTIRLNHLQADLDTPELPMWRRLLGGVIPPLAVYDNVVPGIKNAIELEEKVFDPLVIEPIQEKLRDTKYSSLKTMAEGQDLVGPPPLIAAQRLAKLVPDRAMTAADYLYKAGTKWIFGKDNFEYIDPKQQVEAINDIEAIWRSPVGQVALAAASQPAVGQAAKALAPGMTTDDGFVGDVVKGAASMVNEQGMFTPETAAGTITSGATSFGQLPMFLLGPTQAMEMAAAGKPLGSMMLAAGSGAAQALLDPEISAPEGAAAALMFSGTFVGGKYLVDSMSDLWRASSAVKAGRGVTPVGDFVPTQETSVAFTPAFDQSVAGGIADATPVAELVEVPIVSGGKLSMRPSVALLGEGEIRFFELKAGQKPKVARIPLSNDKNAAYADSLVERFGLDPIPVEGALDSKNKYVRSWMKPELGQDMTTPDGAVLGKRSARTDATAPGRRNTKSQVPGVIEMGEDGHIDIYRITAPAMREKALKQLRPVEATTDSGQVVRGFLLETPSGLAVHPGDEMDLIPGFVDQIVQVRPDKVRALTDAEVKAAAQLTPLQKAQQDELLTGFSDKYVNNYDGLVTDAKQFLVEYAKKNSMFVDTVKRAMDEQKTPSFSQQQKELARKFIIKDQKAVNPDSANKSFTDDEIIAFYGMRQRSNMPNESQFNKVVRLLKNEFGVSDVMADILARDAMGMTKMKSPMDKTFREGLLLEWQTKKSNMYRQKLAAEKKAMPDILPPAKRPQSSLPANVPDPQKGEAAQLGESVMAQEAQAVVDPVLQARDELDRALFAADEAARRGDDFIPQVWVDTKDGVTGRVVMESGSRLTLDTPDGPKVVMRDAVTLHRPPEPPPEALAAGVGIYDNVDGMQKLTNDLADALKNFPEDRVLQKAIERQAREDGRTFTEVSKAYQDAAKMVESGAEPVSRLSGTPPSKPPPPPPPPGGGDPKKAPMGPEETRFFRNVLRNPDFIDRALNKIFGARATVISKHADFAKIVDLAYGAKAASERLNQNIAITRTELGIKPNSELDVSINKVLKNQMSFDDLRKKYPQFLNNRTLQDSVMAYKNEITQLESKLIDLGMLNKTGLTDGQLTDYVTNFYMRRFMAPGDWAKIAVQDKALMKEGTDVFTRFWEARGLQGEDLKQAAEWSVHKFIGEYDGKMGQGGQAADTPQSALMRRSLDELEERIMETMGSDGATPGGFKPGDVDVMRRLLGRNESAILGIANTLTKQRALVAQGEMFRQFVSNFPELVSASPKPNWIEVPKNKAKYGDVAGKYVSPDAYDALIYQPEFIAQTNKLLMAASSWVKGNQIALGGVSTFNTNFFGSTKGAYLSGAIGLGRFPKMIDAARILMGKASKKAFGVEAAISDDLIRLGVDAPGFNETELGSAREKLRDSLYKAYGARKNITMESVFSEGLSMIRKPAATFGAYYDDMDRLWKVGSFLTLIEQGGFSYADGIFDKAAAAKFLSVTPEVKRYRALFDKKQWAKMSPEERLPPAWRTDMNALSEAVKQEATLRISSSFPMPDRVSPAMKEARGAVGIVAPYLTYKSEEARVNVAILQRIRRGEHGLILRVGGMLAAGAGAAEAARQLAYANGITKAEIDSGFENDSPSNKRYRPSRIPLPWKDSLGRVQFADLTSYGDWINEGIDLYNMAAGNDPLMDRMKTMAKNVLFFPFSGSDAEDFGKVLLYRAGLEEAPYSEKLREDQKGVGAVVDDLFRSGVLPKGAAWGYDILRDSQQPEEGRYEPATQSQATARAAGFKVWGVGEISEKNRRVEENMKKSDLAKQTKQVARTPEGSWGRIVGSGELDKEKAREVLQQKREELLNKK